MSRALHEIQRFLYQQARLYPSKPFDNLMRHITDWTVMKAALQRVRSSHGANTPGADHVTARDVPCEPSATRCFLQDLADKLQSGSYHPGPVRRFEIAKPNQPGKTRPLAILILADRVVHMALKLVLEPIIEARLGKRCFGFRPGRSRYDQLQAVRRLVLTHPNLYGSALATDIDSCFDQLDHHLVLGDLRALVSDHHVLGLSEMLLEQVGSGRRGWWQQRRVGVLQGSPLSPLLANWNLSRFDRAWQQKHGDSAPLFRYADDLLLLARDERCAARLRQPLARCLWHANRLNLSVPKTRIGTLDDGIPLLGLMVRRYRDPFTDCPDVRIFLDAVQFRNVLAEIDRWVEQLDPDRPLGPQFDRFNRRLRGWFETYQYTHDAAQAFESLDRHVFIVLRRRLKELLGCSGVALQRTHHLRLPSGHDTWQADGISLLNLSALPRRCYRPKLPRSPWDTPAPKTPVNLSDTATLVENLREEPPDGIVTVDMLRQVGRSESLAPALPENATLARHSPAVNGEQLAMNDEESPANATS